MLKNLVKRSKIEEGEKKQKTKKASYLCEWFIYAKDILVLPPSKTESDPDS